MNRFLKIYFFKSNHGLNLGSHTMMQKSFFWVSDIVISIYGAHGQPFPEQLLGQRSVSCFDCWFNQDLVENVNLSPTALHVLLPVATDRHVAHVQLTTYRDASEEMAAVCLQLAPRHLAMQVSWLWATCPPSYWLHQTYSFIVVWLSECT